LNKSGFEFVPLVDPVIHDEEKKDYSLNVDQSNEYIMNDFKQEEIEDSQELRKNIEGVQEDKVDLYKDDKLAVSR
jgi:hypothetical protein